MGICTSLEEQLYSAIKTINPECCETPLLHKDYYFDLEFFNEHNIPIYYALQQPGDWIVTNPGVSLNLFIIYTVVLYCLLGLSSSSKFRR